MIMYEYTPRSSKRAEKIIVFATLAASLFLVVAAEMLRMLKLSFLLQLAAIFLAACAVLLTSRCLMRRFTYRVEPRENAAEGDAPDLIITEHHGNHVGVVCRISVSDIESVMSVNSKSRKEVSAMLRKKRVYYYTAQLVSSDFYLLTVRDEDEIFYMQILADETLLSFLK